VDVSNSLPIVIPSASSPSPIPAWGRSWP